jgi:hypothetical protein
MIDLVVDHSHKICIYYITQIEICKGLIFA